jgi:hypothetical protein
MPKRRCSHFWWIPRPWGPCQLAKCKPKTELESLGVFFLCGGITGAAIPAGQLLAGAASLHGSNVLRAADEVETGRHATLQHNVPLVRHASGPETQRRQTGVRLQLYQSRQLRAAVFLLMPPTRLLPAIAHELVAQTSTRSAASATEFDADRAVTPSLSGNMGTEFAYEVQW